MEFKKRTREDRKLFDEARMKAHQPTAEELAIEEEKRIAEKKVMLTEKTTRLGIQKPNPVTKERALGFLDSINAKEFLGDDLSGRLDSQEELFGSLDVAFDELIIKYL